MSTKEITLKRYHWTRNVVSFFTFRRILWGAIIYGLFAGGENIAQALGIVTAYPNLAERAKIVHDLSTNPALGMLYGDPHANIASPAGYMVYRTITFLGIIAAVWGLMFITKMLRGQEEDGRWELITSGSNSARSATANTLIGAGLGLVVSYLIIVAIIGLTGTSSKLQFHFSSTLFFALALVSGAALFMAAGAVTSQLAPTRRRAVLYGVGAILVLAVIRGIGNIVDSLRWLKNLTPFGWIDKLHPYSHPQPLWLLPSGAFIILCVGISLYIAGQRDLGQSLVADKDSAKPRLRLLNSLPGFNFRMNRSVLFGWLVGTVALSGLFAGVAKTAAQSLSGSQALSKGASKLFSVSTNSLELLFISVASYFVAILLMVMVINGLGAVRDEEARGRLDNFLVGPISRGQWLLQRLLLLASAAVVICLVASLSVWGIAAAQGISVSVPKLVFGGLNATGPAFLLLGFGVLVYGIRPRLAIALMYVWLAWSFSLDIIASVLKANKYVLGTSLLRHISLVPVTNPDWATFVALAGGGVVLALLGTYLFRLRDLTAE